MVRGEHFGPGYLVGLVGPRIRALPGPSGRCVRRGCCALVRRVWPYRHRGQARLRADAGPVARGLRLQRQPRVGGDLVDPDGGLGDLPGDHGRPGHGHRHGGARLHEPRRRTDHRADPRRRPGGGLGHPRFRGDHEGADVDHLGHRGPDDRLPGPGRPDDRLRAPFLASLGAPDRGPGCGLHAPRGLRFRLD